MGVSLNPAAFGTGGGGNERGGKAGGKQTRAHTHPH